MNACWPINMNVNISRCCFLITYMHLSFFICTEHVLPTFGISWRSNWCKFRVEEVCRWRWWMWKNNSSDYKEDPCEHVLKGHAYKWQRPENYITAYLNKILHECTCALLDKCVLICIATQTHIHDRHHWRGLAKCHCRWAKEIHISDVELIIGGSKINRPACYVHNWLVGFRPINAPHHWWA